MPHSKELPEELKKRFKTHFIDIAVKGKSFKFLEIENMESVLEHIISPSPLYGGERPFWVKIWESSIVLAHHLADIPVNPQEKMLEIGAAMGVAGIVAAAFGHNVTLTDKNEDALAFARVNAAVNGLETLPIRKLDWTDPESREKFHVIFGSDIIYQESAIEPLITFLKDHLYEPGRVYLALSGFIKGDLFFEKVGRFFELDKKSLVLRSEEERYPVNLYTLHVKKRPDDT